MTPEEYLRIRLKNGKICEGVWLDKNGKVQSSHNGLKMPQDNDYYYIIMVAKTMEEFWEKATSQKQLLWMMRGLGMDAEADAIWDGLASAFDLKLHITRISKEDALKYANAVRGMIKCPLLS